MPVRKILSWSIFDNVCSICSVATAASFDASQGRRMSQNQQSKPQSAPGAEPAHMRHAGAGQKRRRLAKMLLGVLAAGASIVVVAVLAIGFGTAPAPVAEKAASHADPNSVGTIVLHSSTSGCQQRSFNNQTGQISNQTSPCRNDVVDAKGMPMPTGTIHTLNSISKSFK
jgi:hypothetical protein